MREYSKVTISEKHFQTFLFQKQSIRREQILKLVIKLTKNELGDKNTFKSPTYRFTGADKINEIHRNNINAEARTNSLRGRRIKLFYGKILSKKGS